MVKASHWSIRASHFTQFRGIWTLSPKSASSSCWTRKSPSTSCHRPDTPTVRSLSFFINLYQRIIEVCGTYQPLSLVCVSQELLSGFSLKVSRRLGHLNRSLDSSSLTDVVGLCSSFEIWSIRVNQRLGVSQGIVVEKVEFLLTLVLHKTCQEECPQKYTSTTDTFCKPRISSKTDVPFLVLIVTHLLWNVLWLHFNFIRCYAGSWNLSIRLDDELFFHPHVWLDYFAIIVSLLSSTVTNDFISFCNLCSLSHSVFFSSIWDIKATTRVETLKHQRQPSIF